MKMTIGRKLSFGFGVTIVLLLLVGVIAYRGLSTAGTGFSEYRRIARNNVLVGRIQANMLDARLDVKNFLASGSDECITQFRQRLDATKGFIEKAQEDITTPANAAKVDLMDQGIQEYETTFNRVIQLTRERARLIEETLDVVGPAIEKQLTQIMESAKADGDSEATVTAGMALRHLLLARLYVVKFLNAHEAAAAQRVRSELAQFDDAVKVMDAHLQNAQRRELLGQVVTGRQTYGRAAEEVFTTIQTMDQLVLQTLDQVGPRVAEAAEEIKLSIIERQDVIGPTVDASNARSLTSMVVVALVAIVVTVVVAMLIIRGITGPVSRFTRAFIELSGGDLTQKLHLKSSDEIGQMSHKFNDFVGFLHSLIQQVNEATREVAAASTQIAASSEEMAQGMSNQTQQVGQITAAVEEMSASVTEVARKSADAAGRANDAGQAANRGGGVVEETIKGMKLIEQAVGQGAVSVSELGKRGEQIGQIIEVINDIADQTNLLALNAAIEAARAGEHGRGFSVVADEVRKLADRTTKATEEISSSITAIQQETTQAVDRMNRGTQEVQSGMKLATQAGQSLSGIVESAREVAGMVQSIAAAAEQQSAAAEQVSRNIEAINAVAQEASHGAGQAATAASQLSSKAEQLQELVSRFRLSA